MKLKNMRCMTAVMLVTPFVALPNTTVAAEKKFTLTKAVPQDVFLVINGRYNPERQFVSDYWGEVCDAAKQSGIYEDVMGLLTQAIGEGEELDKFNELKDRASKLLEGVDWGALTHGEMLFAERMATVHAEGGNIHMGPPDLLWISKADKSEENYAGLVAMLQAGVQEIREASGSDWLKVQEEEAFGAHIARVMLMPPQAQGMGYSVAIAHRDDCVILSAGAGILEESLKLFAGNSKDAPIAASKRYIGAFEGLPEAEDGRVFFDAQGMMKPIMHLFNTAIAEMDGIDDTIINAKNEGEAHELNVQALTAYNQKDMAKALELVRKAAAADPADSRVAYNLACFNALNGDRDAALTALTHAVDAGFYAPSKIAGDGDLESLRDAEEYKLALAKATEMAKANGGNESEVVAKVGGRLLGIPSMFDYIAAVEYTEGYSVHSKSIVKLTDEARNHPFYGVISGKPDIKPFDKYLPEETESFSVAGGFNIKALYAFVEDTVKMAGDDGEEAWAAWEGWQKETNFDIHANVLDWIQGDFISVTLENDGGSAAFVKVTNEDVARQKVGAAVEFLSTKLVEAAAENPALSMIAVRKSPVQDERLKGFENLFIGMSPQPVIWGVANGHLIFGDKASAIVACLETAEGKHPGMRKNARVMQEALVPDGDYVAVSLTDQRKLGQELAAGIGMFSMMSGMMTMGIPDQEVRQVIGKISGMLMKLSPVVSKIDFFKSIASYTTFDGLAWHKHMVTHYQEPTERTASAQ